MKVCDECLWVHSLVRQLFIKINSKCYWDETGKEALWESPEDCGHYIDRAESKKEIEEPEDE